MKHIIKPVVYSIITCYFILGGVVLDIFSFIFTWAWALFNDAPSHWATTLHPAIRSDALMFTCAFVIPTLLVLVILNITIFKKGE